MVVAVGAAVTVVVELAEASVLNKAKRKKTASLENMLRRGRELVGQVVRRGVLNCRKPAAARGYSYTRGWPFLSISV